MGGWALLAAVVMPLSVLVAGAMPARAEGLHEPSVAPADAVITVHGFCRGSVPPALQSCDTIVTRAEFDRLAEALVPGMSVPMRLKVASSYARMMRMGAEAEKRGLDRTAAFSEELRYARLQLLSQDLTRVLEEESKSLNETQVASYYEDHKREFEKATLERIFVPGERPGRGDAGARDGADLRALASALRERAAAGESPEALQVEAFKAAGMEVGDPHTRMEGVLRESLPPTQESVMDLPVGVVSEVLSDPGGGHFIYKMIAKDTPGLRELEGQIRQRLSSSRYRELLKGFEGDVVFNDAYFDPPGARAGSGTTARRPRRTSRDQ